MACSASSKRASSAKIAALAAADHAKILEQDPAADDQQADGGLQGHQGADGSPRRYGTSGFGRGCLMARRLVETGVPFVEVDLGGWDTHANIFTSLGQPSCPSSTRRWRAGRRPRTSAAATRHRHHLDGRVRPHAAHQRQRRPRPLGALAGAWSSAARHQGRQAVGATNADGTDVETEPYTSRDLMASVCKSVGISLDTTRSRAATAAQ